VVTQQVAASMDFGATVLSAARVSLPADLLPVLTGAKPPLTVPSVGA